MYTYKLQIPVWLVAPDFPVWKCRYVHFWMAYADKSLPSRQDERMRKNGLKLYQRKFILDIRIFFPHWKVIWKYCKCVWMGHLGIWFRGFYGGVRLTVGLRSS